MKEFVRRPICGLHLFLRYGRTRVVRMIAPRKRHGPECFEAQPTFFRRSVSCPYWLLRLAPRLRGRRRYLRDVRRGHSSRGRRLHADIVAFLCLCSDLPKQLTPPAGCAMICRQNKFGTEKYPRGRRGSPAKGVVRVNRSQGSNPCFSASKIPPYRAGFFMVGAGRNFAADALDIGQTRRLVAPSGAENKGSAAF